MTAWRELWRVVALTVGSGALFLVGVAAIRGVLALLRLT